MSIAITGGTGFIGRRLAQRLVAEGSQMESPSQKVAEETVRDSGLSYAIIKAGLGKLESRPK